MANKSFGVNDLSVSGTLTADVRNGVVQNVSSVGIGTTTIEDEDTTLYVVGNSEFYGDMTVSGTLTANNANSLTLATAQNVSGLGTSVDFTGIPSWVKRVTVMFDGVSTNGGSSIPIIQLGNSGGIETTSYSGQGDSFTQSSGALNIFNTTAHTIGFNLAANGIYLVDGSLRGISTIIKLNSNTWVISSYASQAVGASAAATGTKTLSGTLDRIRITTVDGTDTFDNGTINIMYE